MDASIDIYMIFPLENNDSVFSNFSILSDELDRRFCFWLFFIFDISAILCSVFTLYHLLAKPNSRQALQNHALILMLLFGLVYNVIDIPLHLQFFNFGVVRPAVPELCLIWWFIDWGFFFTIEMLLLLTSIERHIFIFHSQMLVTHRRRLLIHYFPMLLIVSFMMIFYGVAIFAPICDNTFDYTSDLCGMYACYAFLPFFITVERMGFSMMSSCFIVILNAALLVRFIRQKQRLHRPIQWRKQRKLVIQMILMAMLFSLFSLPLTIIHLVRLFGQPDWAMEMYSSFFLLSYFSIFFLPFVCFASLPNLWDKVKNLAPRRRWQIVAAVIQ